MPDVSSTAPAQVGMWVALDVHKLSIVAATLLRRALKHALQALASAPPDGDSMAELLGPARQAITDAARPKIRALRQPRAVGVQHTGGALA